MKVGYRTSPDSPYEATAYLDDEPLPDGSYAGTNKHTDLPVHLRWDDDREVWVEVCHREWDMPNVYLGVWKEVLPRPECVCPENPPVGS